MGYLANFYYQVRGLDSGPKLVFLHGLMGSSANWRRIASSFEDSFQILIYDQRGHGRSFHPQSGFTPEDYAQDLRLILDELGWSKEKIYLVGHSMGGRNALSFAHLLPDRIEKLVIEDIGPDTSAESVKKIESYLKAIPTPFSSKQLAKDFFDHEFPKIWGREKGGRTLAQFFYMNIEEKEGGVADWRFSRQAIFASISEARTRERWDQVQALKVPTLWVRGSDSEDLSHETYLRVLKSNPLIQGVEISGAGHWVHFDQAEEFIQTLRRFFLA